MKARVAPAARAHASTARQRTRCSGVGARAGRAEGGAILIGMIDGQRGWDAWRPALWLAMAAVAMVGIDLGRRILATNDEARFAMLAQDMFERGAWLFPQLNGVAYNAKPPLHAWLIAIASWPAGQLSDRSRFRVLPLDQLNFDQIVLVSRSPEAPRSDSRP